jgi:competence protein ComEC
MVEAAMESGYETQAESARHPRRGSDREMVSTMTLVVLAVAVALAIVTRSWVAGIVTGAGALARDRRWLVAVGGALLVVVAAYRSSAAWTGLVPERLGSYVGWATVVEESRPYGGATRVLVEVDDERFEMWIRGRAGQLRVTEWRAGDVVQLAGERTVLEPDRVRRVAWQHVVGELNADWLGDRVVGGRLAAASNRVRMVIERGAAALRPDQAALTRGLVIGDDRHQPAEMVERFRTSGLSHLMAVSGQNVAFVVAAAGPLLRRAPPFARWLLTILLIAWFVVITRAEPSVLRAGVMAGLGATAFVLGRQHDPVRMLAVTVIVLLTVDPLLAWSVGFWLSVGATAGVTVVGPWLAPRLARLRWLAAPLGVTLGAQVGVAVPSLLVFGRLSLVGTVANLVAVPVAGMVMLYGLPACLLAGALPVVAPVVMAPVGAGVRWIDAVATVGAALEPEPPWTWLGWLVLVAVLLAAVASGGARLTSR